MYVCIMYVCIMSGVELMHDSMVGMGTCGPRVSSSRSGGETTAALQSRDSLAYEGKEKRQSEWAELGCLIVYKYLYSMVSHRH